MINYLTCAPKMINYLTFIGFEKMTEREPQNCGSASFQAFASQKNTCEINYAKINLAAGRSMSSPY